MFSLPRLNNCLKLTKFVLWKLYYLNDDYSILGYVLSSFFSMNTSVYTMKQYRWNNSLLSDSCARGSQLIMFVFFNERLVVLHIVYHCVVHLVRSWILGSSDHDLAVKCFFLTLGRIIIGLLLSLVFFDAIRVNIFTYYFQINLVLFIFLRLRIKHSIYTQRIRFSVSFNFYVILCCLYSSTMFCNNFSNKTL